MSSIEHWEVSLSIAPDEVPAKTPEDANRDVVKHIYNGALLKDIFYGTNEQIQLVSGFGSHPFALPVEDMIITGFLYDQVQVASFAL